MAKKKTKDSNKKGGLNGIPYSTKAQIEAKYGDQPAGAVPVGPTPAGLAPPTRVLVPGVKGIQAGLPGGRNELYGVKDRDKNSPVVGGKGKGGKFHQGLPEGKGGRVKTKGGGGGGGGGSADDMFEWQKKEAERARQDEKDRQNRIKKGMEKIDTAFAGFDNNFYSTREQNYKNYYMSQATPEFQKARDNLTYALSRAGQGPSAGVQESSAATTTKAQNEFEIANKTGQISAQAAADRSKTEAQIAAERSALVTTLNNNAQANAIGNEATAKVSQLNSQAPDYNWVPDLFFGASQGVGALVQAGQNAQFTSAFNGGVGAPRATSGVTRGGTSVY